MSHALWKLSIRQSRLLFLAIGALMFGFEWLFVWLTAQLEISKKAEILQALPDFFKKGLLPVEVERMLTPEGQLAMGWDHPLITFACLGWAVTRASDVVSGPLGRGNLELLLAQPIPRYLWLFVHTTVSSLGAACLVALCWLGMVCGTLTVPLFHNIEVGRFTWAALNLFSMTFFMIAVTTMVSAMDRYRSRTIGLVLTFFIVSTVIKVIGRATPEFSLLQYFSFLSAFEPERIMAASQDIAGVAFNYCSILLGLAFACFGVAGYWFQYRDLPAPH